MTVSLWLDPAPPPRPPLSGEHSCDVLVIGAGLCGASTALALAREGARVLLVEARRAAGGASGRNAGFLLQGAAESHARLAELRGRERARAVQRWSLANIDAVQRFVAEGGASCGFRRRGSLRLAASQEEAAELRRSAAILAEDGFEARILPDADLPEPLRAAGYRLGLLRPDDAEVHPAELVHAILREAERAGAAVHEGSPVLSMDASTPGAVLASTPAAHVRASLAVVATNARAPELLPRMHGLVDPVRGQVLATAPAPPLFDRPIYARHGYEYWRQEPSGRVVLGGWRYLDPDAETGLDDRLHPSIQERMAAFLRGLGVHAGITHRWAGTMGFSRDGLPLVGPAPGASGALVAAGFTGHGFGFAFLAGQALAATALGGSHPFCSDFDPRRMEGR